MHNPWCISFDRSCRAGGEGCCDQCPFVDRRTPEQKRDSLVASWLHQVKYGRYAIENVPTEYEGMQLRAEVARRDAETVLVKGDFEKGRRSKIVELEDTPQSELVSNGKF